MHFENVSVLTAALTDIISEMGYCWRDPQGYICHQNGVFRVNCIDCLDRTNVVQVCIELVMLKVYFIKKCIIAWYTIHFTQFQLLTYAAM